MNRRLSPVTCRTLQTYSLASRVGRDYSATSGLATQGSPATFPVKITLNTTSIPDPRRPQVEALVKSFAKATEIVWLPSRFPRFVMLVEPGPEDKSQAESGSIFESPLAGTRSLASVTEFLEVRIKDCLAGPPG
jgi:hypothetical protein